MRLMANNSRPIIFKEKIINKSNEGGEYESWGKPVIIKGIIWSGGGQLQIEQYGDRLNYIKNVRVDGKYRVSVNDNGQTIYTFPNIILKEGDGVYVNANKNNNPDYKIISIIPSHPLKMEIEKI